jgi:acetyl-CoA synthetase
VPGAPRGGQAAAVASPDARRGTVVKAFIVLAKGRGPSVGLGEEVGAFVRERHSAYAYPRRVEFVDALPKTLTGKIRRIEPRERERERMSATP